MASASEVFAPTDRTSATDKLGIGSPARTLALREKYRRAREERDISWEDWLSENGYGADANGNAYLKEK